MEDKGLLGVTPLSFFFFDRKHTEAVKGIYLEKTDSVWARWEKIREAVGRLSNHRMRRRAWLLLRKCDSRTREGTESCHLQIQTLLNTITQEQIRLDTLRKTVSQRTLFPWSHIDVLRQYSDTVQAQLDRARTLVEEARTLLEPAKRFFVNQRSPSRHKTKIELLKMLKTLPSIDRKKAASLASMLLNLADPKRPTTQEAIRQLGYARYRPE